MAITNIADLAQPYFTGQTGIALSETGSFIIEATAGDVATTRSVLGTYDDGLGEDGRFFPFYYGINVIDGAYLQFNGSGIVLGTPLSSDGEELQHGQDITSQTAQGDTDRAEERNWLTDERGVYLPEGRVRLLYDYDAAPGGNGASNRNFVGGNTTSVITTLMGVDLFILTDSGAAGTSGNSNGRHSHLHIGGTGQTFTSIPVEIFNTNIFFDQTTSGSLNNNRVKFYSNNIYCNGLRVDFGETERISFELDANGTFPRRFDNVELLDRYNTIGGTEGRQFVILNSFNVSGGFEEQLVGLNARNVTLWSSGGTVDASDILTLLNPIGNILKPLEPVNGIRGELHVNRTLRTNTSLVSTGGVVQSTYPSVSITRHASDTDKDNYRFSTTNTTAELTAITVADQSDVPTSTPVAITTTNAIDSDGAFSIDLRHYEVKHSTTARQFDVEMYNKYHIAFTNYGYTPHVVEDDGYYLGSQLVASSAADIALAVEDSDGDAEVNTKRYFSPLDLNNRLTYSATGIMLDNVALQEDPVVLASGVTQATVNATDYQHTSTDEIWCGIHNWVNNRDDEDNTQVGKVVGSATTRNIVNLGSTGTDYSLIFERTARTAGTGESKVGGVVAGGSGNDIYVRCGTNVDITTTGVQSFLDVDTFDFGANISWDLADGANLTIRASVIENLPLIIDSGMVFDNDATHTNTWTSTSSTNETLTVVDSSDVSGLTIVHNGTGTLTIEGAVEDDFLSVSGTGTIVYAFTDDYVIDATSIAQDAYYRFSFAGAYSTEANTFGTITAGGTETISIRAALVGHSTDDEVILSIVAPDAVEVYRTFSAGDGGGSISIGANVNYNSGATADSRVAISVPTSGDNDGLLQFTIDSNTNITPANTNRTFCDLKGTQTYADFIEANTADASVDTNSQISIFLKSSYHRLVTESDGVNNSGSRIGQVFVDSGTVADITTNGSFTGSGNIGLAVTNSDEVDYSQIQSQLNELQDALETSVESEGQNTIDELTTEINGANGV